MNTGRALRWFARAESLARTTNAPEKLYATIGAAMSDLIGYRLLTIQRLTRDGNGLRRTYSSDPSFPLGGVKDIGSDPWIRHALAKGDPVITPNRSEVAAAFKDHEAIFALGCGAVLNIPVCTPAGTLGSLNLLHGEGWFALDCELLARPFATLLALVWSHAPSA